MPRDIDRVFADQRSRVNVEYAGSDEPLISEWGELPITMRELLIGVYYAGKLAGIDGAAKALGVNVDG